MTNEAKTGSALLACVVNALLVGALLLGILQLPGRDPDRILWVDALGWLIYLMPLLNALCAVLALFASARPRLRRFTWGAAAAGAAYVAYLAVALFVFY